MGGGEAGIRHGRQSRHRRPAQQQYTSPTQHSHLYWSRRQHSHSTVNAPHDLPRPGARRATPARPGRAARRALCRTHRPAPAAARRAAAVGARLRAAPRRQPEHGGGRLRPAAGAGPGRGAPPARLLRARAGGRARAGAAAPPRAHRAAAPVDATALIRGMFQQPRLAARARASARCRPSWLDLPLLHGALRRAMAERRRQRAAATATRPATRGCARRWRAAWPTSASPATPGADRHHRWAPRTRWTSCRARLLRAGRCGAGRRARLGGRVRAAGARWACGCCRCRAAPDGPDLDVMQRADRSRAPAAPVRDRVGAAQPDRLLAVAGRRAPGAAAGRGARLPHRRGRHLRLAGAAARAAPGRARRPAAHDLRLGLLEDPGAELARRLHRRAAGAGRALRRHEAADLAHHAGAAERALALVPGAGPAAPPRRARGGAARRGARARRCAWREDAGCRFVTPPQGLFGWIDTGVDTERLAQALLDDGWLLAPGALFHATPRPTSLMRINFATSQDPRFWQALIARDDRAYVSFRVTPRNISASPIVFRGTLL